MKIARTLQIILLAGLGSGSPASADATLEPGDIVTVRCRNESSRAEVVISARNSQRLLIKLEAIVSGHSGIVQVFSDGTGKGYRLATGEKVSIIKRTPSVVTKDR